MQASNLSYFIQWPFLHGNHITLLIKILSSLNFIASYFTHNFVPAHCTSLISNTCLQPTFCAPTKLTFLVLPNVLCICIWICSYSIIPNIMFMVLPPMPKQSLAWSSTQDKCNKWMSDYCSINTLLQKFSSCINIFPGAEDKKN